jgi:hypothetical protein
LVLGRHSASCHAMSCYTTRWHVAPSHADLCWPFAVLALTPPPARPAPCPHTPPSQTLANNGRFGRELPIEQQTFLVLADTVLKQIDSLKSADTGVGGPVRK